MNIYIHPDIYFYVSNATGFAQAGSVATAVLAIAAAGARFLVGRGLGEGLVGG